MQLFSPNITRCKGQLRRARSCLQLKHSFDLHDLLKICFSSTARACQGAAAARKRDDDRASNAPDWRKEFKVLFEESEQEIEREHKTKRDVPMFQWHEHRIQQPTSTRKSSIYHRPRIRQTLREDIYEDDPISYLLQKQKQQHDIESPKVLDNVLTSIFPKKISKPQKPKTPRIDFDLEREQELEILRQYSVVKVKDDYNELYNAEPPPPTMRIHSFHESMLRRLRDEDEKERITEAAKLKQQQLDNGILKEQKSEIARMSAPKTFVLTLYNMGTTMLESDIRRVLSMPTPDSEGWSLRDPDIKKVVPARDSALTRLPFYHLHFQTAEARDAYRVAFSKTVARARYRKLGSTSSIPGSSDGEDAKPQGIDSVMPQQYNELENYAQAWDHPGDLTSTSRPTSSSTHHPFITSPGRTVRITVAALFWGDLDYFITDLILENGGYAKSLVNTWKKQPHIKGFGGVQTDMSNLTEAEAPIELVKNVRKKVRAIDDREGAVWVVRFQKGDEGVAEANRLVRDWHMRWIRLETSRGAGYWVRVEAELLH